MSTASNRPEAYGVPVPRPQQERVLEEPRQTSDAADVMALPRSLVIEIAALLLDDYELRAQRATWPYSKTSALSKFFGAIRASARS